MILSSVESHHQSEIMTKESLLISMRRLCMRMELETEHIDGQKRRVEKIVL